MDDKMIWFIDELQSHGIYPRLRTANESSLGAIGIGGRVDVDKLVGMEQEFFSLETFGGWAPNVNFEGTDTELGGSYRIMAPGSVLYHDGLIDFSRSSSESFYGISDSTSLGEWSTYSFEELRFESGFGGDILYDLEGRIGLEFQHVKIGNGNRTGVGKIKEHFAGFDVPGLDGGNILALTTGLEYDKRDHKKDPKRGSYGNLNFSYHHDVDGKDLQYIKSVRL